MLVSMRSRKFLNIFLWLVIFAFLATIFVVWGLGDKQQGGSYVAKVGDKTVSYNEFQTLQRQYRTMGDVADNASQLDRYAIEQLINNKLFLHEAERLQVPVSDAEVQSAVLSSNVFYNEGGRFDVDRYKAILAANGITPAAYELGIREEIALNKVQGLIVSAVAITDEEINYEYNYQNLSIAGSYFLLNSADFNADTATDEALAGYYAGVSERYRKPAEVKIKYISFNENSFEFTPTITDDDVKNRYNASISSYITPEMVELYNISVIIPDMNETAVSEAKAKLALALEELKAGADFAEVASKYSEEPGLAETGGYVGRITKPAEDVQMTEEEKLIFALPAGGITDVIVSDFGVHIFKVTEKIPATITSFEEAKDGIYTRMVAEAETAAYRSHLYNVSRDIMSAGNITAYINEHPDAYTVEETNYIPENEPRAFFQDNEELKTALFSAGIRDTLPMVDVDGDTLIIEIVDRKESYVPALDEVRDEVLAAYNRDNAFQKAIDTATAKVETVDSEAGFTALANEFSSTLVNFEPFSRMGVAPVASWGAEFVESAFYAQVGDVLVYPEPLTDKVYLVYIADIIPADAASLDSVKDGISRYLLAMKQMDAMNSALAELRKQYPVEINPNFTNLFE